MCLLATYLIKHVQKILKHDTKSTKEGGDVEGQYGILLKLQQIKLGSFNGVDISQDEKIHTIVDDLKTQNKELLEELLELRKNGYYYL